MNGSNATGYGRGPFIERFGVSIGTLALIVAQTIAVVGWLVNDHATITYLIENNGRLVQRIDSVDANGTRFGTTYISRITQLDAEIIASNRQFESVNSRLDTLRSVAQTTEVLEAKLQAQIDLLKQEDNRIEEQQTRIIQALDNTYNLLQEHLRSHNGNKDAGPPNLKLR